MKTSKTSPSAARRLARQAGMTLLEILIVLAIIALVMGVLFGPKLMDMFGESKAKLAKIMVQEYANQAYARWSMNNPGKNCPDDINELAKYTDQSEAKDPWDQKLTLLCGDSVPEGSSFRVGVVSKGPDGKENTSDDIKSWGDTGKGEGN